MNWPALVMGSIGSGLVAFGFWCRPRKGRRIPDMECIACGYKGLMGELAPGEPCCAPCRESIEAEVEGRAHIKEAPSTQAVRFMESAEAARHRMIQRDTQAAIARRLMAKNAGRTTLVDCRPKDIPRFYPDRQQWVSRGALYNVEELEDELPFVPQAMARKERS